MSDTQDNMNDQRLHEQCLHDQWWLATLGRNIVWARLRVRDAGTAEVFDSDGNTLSYDSQDTARAALMDAEFVAWDGIDPEDALARGFSLDEVQPPSAVSDEALARHMFQSLTAPALANPAMRAADPNKPT